MLFALFILALILHSSSLGCPFRPRHALLKSSTKHLHIFVRNSSTIFRRFGSNTHSTQHCPSHNAFHKCACTAFLMPFAVNTASIFVLCMHNTACACSHCIVTMLHCSSCSARWVKYSHPEGLPIQFWRCIQVVNMDRNAETIQRDRGGCAIVCTAHFMSSKCNICRKASQTALERPLSAHGMA